MKKVLCPIYDSRKSFYGKAVVDGNKLYSYDTLVCIIDDGNYYLNANVNNSLLLSQTTMRHIKEFIKQELGLEVTKKELLQHITYIC